MEAPPELPKETLSQFSGCFKEALRPEESMSKKTFSLVVLAIMLGAASAGWAGTEKVLYSFAGGTDGINPFDGLVADKAGNLYGTTQSGGAIGLGTVFELSPSSGGSWTEKILYSFCSQPPNCADGNGPTGGLIFDQSGNLYGTTGFGGNEACDGGCGTVFELSPNSDGTWTETVLHSFNGTDGYDPTNSLLIFDKAGNIYGTTQVGGAYGGGTVFKLNAGSETVLYSFCSASNCSDGYGLEAGVIFDKSGNLYGETYGGGAYGDDGTVFKLSPSSDGGWKETVLHSFRGPDGSSPIGGLVFDKEGNLYGSTYSGGANNDGEVFKLARSKHGWKETVLHSFKGLGYDGDYPYDALILDKSGNLFGTTSSGGDCTRCGTVFELKPSQGWKETVLYKFKGNGDASEPFGSLLVGKSGRLYGTTYTGGTGNCSGGCGTVFEVTP